MKIVQIPPNRDVERLMLGAHSLDESMRDATDCANDLREWLSKSLKLPIEVLNRHGLEGTILLYLLQAELRGEDFGKRQALASPVYQALFNVELPQPPKDRP